MRHLSSKTFVATAIAVQICVAQVTTYCSLYGNSAQCTSYDNGASAAEQQREAYQTGQSIGRGIGFAIFRAYFPGWRRKYCSRHPRQPFVYANADGDSISGMCPTINDLANEVAAEWCAKHPEYKATPVNGQAMVSHITDNQLSFLDKKSYDKAFRHLKTNGAQPTSVPASASMPDDLFVWFDESTPQPGVPLFEVVVTSRAYDGALAILRQVRQRNTAVQAGASVLDTDYHPPTVSLGSWKNNPSSDSSLFYWQGEDISSTTPVMHFQMTRRAYEQMLALLAGSSLRMRPAQLSNAPR